MIAESFDRIHRSNLIAMGILPLQFIPGAGVKWLMNHGIRGTEMFDIELKINPMMFIERQATVPIRVSLFSN